LTRCRPPVEPAFSSHPAATRLPTKANKGLARTSAGALAALAPTPFPSRRHPAGSLGSPAGSLLSVQVPAAFSILPPCQPTPGLSLRDAKAAAVTGKQKIGSPWRSPPIFSLPALGWSLPACRGFGRVPGKAAWGGCNF